MAIVRIKHVEQQLHEQLLGASIDAPIASGASSTYSFNVKGWALGRVAGVESFQVMDGDRVAAEVPPNETRSDVSGTFPDVAAAENSGFQTLVRAIELPRQFCIEVIATLKDGTKCHLATIEGEREPLAVDRTPALRPLMLTTIGRSGSKWLAWLVSCHPSIVAFQPLVFEPRVTTYWATVFRALTAPRSYLRQIHTERWDEPRWWLGDGSGPLPAPVELGIADWLGTDAMRQIGAACQERVEAFYLQVMEKSGAADVRYFAEKCLLDLTSEIFPGARELILVRDFRDRLSSVFAWNEKRDDHGFGHEAEMSKAEYVAERVRADAEGLLRRRRRQGDAAHLVRYEDLILRPAETLTGLLEYLELDAGTSLVEGMLEEATRPGELLDAHRTVSDPAQTIGRWRRDLPPALAEECNEVLAPVLAEFGYSTDLEAVEGGE